MENSLQLAPPAFAGYAWDVVLSLGLFCSAAMLVMTLFAHGGEVHLSPQREAALATGHTDRKTVFESTALKSIMWALLSVCYRLNLPWLKRWVDRKLVAAGSPNYYTGEEYLALSLLTGIVLMLFLEMFNFIILGDFSVVLLVLAPLAGVGLNLMHLNQKASMRMRLIARRLPYALDLISLAMGAGATFVEALKTIVRERSDDPLNQEFKAALAEMDLGTTRQKAMQNLAARVPQAGVRSLVASVLQAEELGTPLHNVLHDQATLQRMARSTAAENAAAVASTRIMLPGLLIVMAVILVIFGPAIVRGIRGGLF